MYFYIMNDVIIATREEFLKDKIVISPLQLEIARLSADGFSGKEIGAELNITHRAIESQRSALIKKTDCFNMVHCVAFLMRKGVIS